MPSNNTVTDGEIYGGSALILDLSKQSQEMTAQENNSSGK